MSPDQRRAWERRLKSSTRALTRLVEEIQGTYPDASLYLANNTLNVLSGPHHLGDGEAERDSVLLSASLPHGDGGDW